MENCKRSSRRDFIKLSAAGVASGVVASNTVANSLASSDSEKSVTFRQSPIPVNPEIEDTRVVFVHDEDMVNESYSSVTWGNMSSQNSATNKTLIKSHMDKMAVALAENGDSSAAWAKIFRKPENKNWSEVKVAIKINTIGKNYPRLAIVSKVCEELINLGVMASSIVVYDAHSRHTQAEELFSGYVGSELPAGVVVSKNRQEINIKIPDLEDYTKCTDILVDSSGKPTRDILINIAVAKGHGPDNGGVTLTMKNHIGSFLFSCPWQFFNSFIKMNQHDAVLGGDEQNGIPARQQLNIIDALWASKSNSPSASPNRDTDRIIMGTSSPMVDYFTSKHLMEPVVGQGVSWNLVNRFVTDFGYKTNDVENMDMVDALEYEPVSNFDLTSNKGKPKQVTLTLLNSTFKNTNVKFDLPGDSYITSLLVFDMKGKVVRDIQTAGDGSKKRTLTWDGKDMSGRNLSTGTYIIQCKAGKVKSSAKLSLIK